VINSRVARKLKGSFGMKQAREKLGP